MGYAPVLNKKRFSNVLIIRIRLNSNPAMFCFYDLVLFWQLAISHPALFGKRGNEGTRGSEG